MALVHPNISPHDNSTSNALTATSVVLAVLVAIYFSSPPSSVFRDLVYAFPALLFTTLLANSHFNVRIYPALIVVLVTFLAWQGSIIVTRGHLYDTTTSELSFIFLSALVFVPAYYSTSQFGSLLLISGIANILAIMYFRGFGPIRLEWLSSDGFSETGMGLILPLLAALAFLNQRWFFFLVTLALSFLMYKRIALFAFPASLAVALLIGRHRGLLRYFSAALIVGMLTLTSLYSEQILLIVRSAAIGLFNIGINLDVLTMGRFTGAVVFQSALHGSSAMEIAFGHGAGFTAHVLASEPALHDKNFRLLHNDWLRIYADYGCLGLAVIGWGFARALASADRRVVVAAAYTAIVFMTDNVATYAAYWFCLAFLVRQHQSDRSVSRRGST